MFGKVIVAVIALGLFGGSAARADYPADRKAAEDLMRTGKSAEAMAAFIKLAEGPLTDMQKSDALDRAARLADSLKKYDQAMELAQKIPLAPVSKTCQMAIMQNNYKRAELIEKFKDEDIAAWPDSLKGEAFFQRGLCYYYLKNGPAAEKDLIPAAEFLTEANAYGLALNALGDTYRDLLKDDAKALDAYRRVHTTSFTYKVSQAAISAAGILTRQGKPDEALQELQRIDMKQVDHPYWRVYMLAAFGDVLGATPGKKAEAVAKYKEALQIPDIRDYQKTAILKALDALEGAGK